MKKNKKKSSPTIKAFSKAFTEMDAKLNEKDIYKKNKNLIFIGLAILVGALFASVVKVLLIGLLFAGLLFLLFKYKKKKEEVVMTDEAIQKMKQQNTEAE